MNPRVRIRFSEHDFPIDSDDWPIAATTVIDRYWNGERAPTGRHCGVWMQWTTSALYVRFEGTQNEPFVVFEDPDTSKKHIGLWERDVCELFIGPDARDLRRYAEFEVAPTGEWLDLTVDWNEDEPRDWKFDSGMEAFSRVEADRVTMSMKIPWTAFGGAPSVGDVWFGNMFRQVGSGETRGYLAWSPTMTPEPQFHVPEKFGEFEFV